jgi:DNA-binding transcriptional LysR family regulator
LPTAFLTRLARFAGPEPLVLTEGSDAELRRKLGEGQIDAALTLLREGEDARRHRRRLSHDAAGKPPPGGARDARSGRTGERHHDRAPVLRTACRNQPLLHAARVRPRFLLRSANDDRCMAMVRAGMGVTTAPDRSVAKAWSPCRSTVTISGGALA